MLRYVLMLAAVVGLGLLSRLHPIGWSVYDKSLGDVLYAIAAYLVVALLLSRWRPSWVAALALSLCLSIESLQATGIPARYAQVPIVRWLLGTTFSWHDVVCYGLGIVLIWILDAHVLRASPHGN